MGSLGPRSTFTRTSHDCIYMFALDSTRQTLLTRIGRGLHLHVCLRLNTSALNLKDHDGLY